MSKIRLSEAQLHRVIKESVKKILRENEEDDALGIGRGLESMHSQRGDLSHMHFKPNNTFINTNNPGKWFHATNIKTQKDGSCKVYVSAHDNMWGAWVDVWEDEDGNIDADLANDDFGDERVTNAIKNIAIKFAQDNGVIG
jgi:hypothetical protein